MNNIITLTSDFGLEDHYVGAMKGVILSINPDIKIIDISHSVAKYDVLSGAFLLKNSYSYYPKGTIHVAVVDPGVGSNRKPIAVLADGHYFIAPDNGILSFILRGSESFRAYEITCADYMREQISSTFHGRDIFAPAAAYLASGADVEKLGKELESPVLLDMPEPEVEPGRITGRVVHVDSFGNLVTNIPSNLVNQDSEIIVGDSSLGSPKRTYQSVSAGTAIPVIGSSGLLEISVNQGSAFKALGKDVTITVISE